MKCIIAILTVFFISGCSLFNPSAKRAPEIVPSCFSDGENQASYCKTQRVGEDRRIITTRCIGTQNQEAKVNLRGKCVEKICSDGSNTDCQVRGEFAVLEQYAELVTSKLFSSDEEAQAKKETALKEKEKDREKAKAKVAVHPTPSAEAAVPPKKTALKEEEAEKTSMKMVLKPAKKTRALASVKEAEKGTKKICVAKNEMAAPESFRGKCAVRTCTNSKCTYYGKKALFEWGLNIETETQ